MSTADRWENRLHGEIPTGARFWDDIDRAHQIRTSTGSDPFVGRDCVKELAELEIPDWGSLSPEEQLELIVEIGSNFK